jgi:hypothetical protein
VEQQGTHSFIQCTQNALGLAILLAGIGAGEADDSTVGRQEGVHGGVIKLAAVVCLQRKNGPLKLSLNIGKKCRDSVRDFRLVAERK